MEAVGRLVFIINPESTTLTLRIAWDEHGRYKQVFLLIENYLYLIIQRIFEMKELNDELRLLIISDESANPFTDSFNEKIVREKFEKQDSPILDFIVYCNSIFIDTTNQITETLSKLSTTKDRFFNALFRRTNQLFYQVVEETRQILGKKIFSELERVNFVKSENINNGADIKFLAEIGPDISAEIIKQVNAYEEVYVFYNQENRSTEAELLESIRRLFIYCNVLVNVRDSAYSILVHEEGSVQITENGNFKINSGLKTLPFIKAAGEIRSDNHSNEAMILLQGIITDSPFTYNLQSNYSGDEFSFSFSSNKNKKSNLTAASALLTYHFYLLNIKLDYFDGLTIRDLSNVLYLFDSAMSDRLHNDSDLGKQPVVRVTKENIKSIITTATKKSDKIVDRIIASLCSTTAKIYFWEAPFYEVDMFYYCPIVSLVSPNYNLYYEKWLTLAGIDFIYREKLFTESIIQEIKQTDYEFSLKILSFHSIGLQESFFSNNILLETRDFYILVQTSLYGFPIEQKEIKEAIFSITKSLEELINKKSLIEKYTTSEKEFFLIIITNYTHFSGVVLNGIPIADFILFNSYFGTGKFKKVRMVSHKDKLLTSNKAEFSYYHNEDEFNNNIKSFFAHPVPVHKIIENFFLKEISITPDFFESQILIDKVEILSEEETIDENIQNLEHLLKIRYYGDENLNKERIDETINYNLTVILNKLSYNSEEILKYRWNLHQAIILAKETGFLYLSLYIINSFPKLNIFIDDESDFEPKDLDKEILEKTLEKLSDSFSQKQRISTFEINDTFSYIEKEQLLSYAFNVTSNFSPGIHNDDDRNEYIFSLMIMSGLRKDFNISKILFSAFSNWINFLNHDNRTQDARDFCEEILIIYSQENKHWDAWCIIFKCYTSQKNHFDAAIHGCMLFTCLTSMPQIPYYLLVSSLHNALIFFRNFKYYDFAKKIYASSKQISFKEYDEQKIAASYFNMLLLDPDSIKNQNFSNEIYNYLNEKIDRIVHFGTHGAFPWLSIIYNLIRARNEYGIKFNEDILRFKLILEASVSEKQKEHLETIILGNPANLKESFVRALKHIFQSRSVEDFSAEITNLTPIAMNLLKYSISIDDVEGIFLSGEVLNDQTFVFQNKSIEIDGLRPAISEIPPELADRWYNYDQKILQEINFKEGDLIIWIFEVYHEVYRLIISEEKKWDIKKLENWNIGEITNWVGSLDKFFFNSKRIPNYDIEQQEQDYDKLISFLSFTDLMISQKISQLFLITSIDLSEFPHNLYIQDRNFIGAQFPVCNVLSFERFLKKSKNIFLDFNFSSSAWIPIEDQEETISWGYNLLEPILKSFGSVIHTSQYPKSQITSDINIFLAHGEATKFGFKAIHTKKGIEGTVLYPSYVFGKGKIAVLFICNSGKVSDDIYLNHVVSFAASLLKNSYEAVVAPFWKLDVTISPIWLNVFINSLRVGFSMSEAVFLSNKEISKYQESISNSFYAAEGQLVMHLYGNPNIFIKGLQFPES